MAGRGGGVAVLRCGTDGRVGGRTNRSRTVSFDAREPASGHAGVAPRNRTVAPKEPSMSTHEITEGSVVVGVDGSPSSESDLMRGSPRAAMLVWPPETGPSHPRSPA